MLVGHLEDWTVSHILSCTSTIERCLGLRLIPKGTFQPVMPRRPGSTSSFYLTTVQPLPADCTLQYCTLQPWFDCWRGTSIHTFPSQVWFGGLWRCKPW
ncbi:hypothetical protein GE21DRAFT_1280254 [Neurospora crassa]|nr:hypothetical protein GE21DRAFT_1280254 [Neurospora crassa]